MGCLAWLLLQTFNLILLTAVELRGLRTLLERCFNHPGEQPDKPNFEPNDQESYTVFKTLYITWCHNPVAALSLCLLAQAYHISSLLIPKFCDMSISLDVLMQLDRLVLLVESPIFLRQRLQLMEPRSLKSQLLIKTLYGVLMLLPQSTAFTTLNERLKSITPLYMMLNQTVRSSATLCSCSPRRQLMVCLANSVLI